MFAKTAIFSVMTAAVAITGAMGAALPQEETTEGGGLVRIATDWHSACNPPNNGDHSEGSSCKYYTGPSDSSHVFEGTCHFVTGQDGLKCI